MVSGFTISVLRGYGFGVYDLSGLGVMVSGVCSQKNRGNGFGVHTLEE